MNRTKSREMWQRVAKGELTCNDSQDEDDLAGWMRELARKVLKADENADEKQRPYDITAAVGLKGRLDYSHELRRQLSIRNEFEPLGTPKRGLERATLVAIARTLKPEWSQFTDDTIRKRVQRLLNRPTE